MKKTNSGKQEDKGKGRAKIFVTCLSFQHRERSTVNEDIGRNVIETGRGKERNGDVRIYGSVLLDNPLSVYQVIVIAMML